VSLKYYLLVSECGYGQNDHSRLYLIQRKTEDAGLCFFFHPYGLLTPPAKKHPRGWYIQLLLLCFHSLLSHAILGPGAGLIQRYLVRHCRLIGAEGITGVHGNYISIVCGN